MKLARRVSPTHKLCTVTSQSRISPLDCCTNGKDNENSAEIMSKAVRKVLATAFRVIEPLQKRLRSNCNDNNNNNGNSNNKTAKKKQVRFDDYANEEYSNMELCKEDCSALWYSAEEIQHHRQEAQQLSYEMHSMRQASFHDIPAWFESLERGYQAFTTCRTTAEIQQVLANTPHIMNLSAMGMERRILPVVVQDSMTRRRNMYAAVRECQEMSHKNEKLQAKKIREACRTISLPCKLFARHVAQLSVSVDLA